MNAAAGQPQGGPQAGPQGGPPRVITPQEINDITALSEANIGTLEQFGQDFGVILANTRQINQYLTDTFREISMLIGRLQNINDSDEFNATILALYTLLDRYNNAVGQADIRNNNDALRQQIDGINQLLASHIFVYIVSARTSNEIKRQFSGDYVRENGNIYRNVMNTTLSNPAENQYSFNNNIATNIEDLQNKIFGFDVGGQRVIAKIIKFSPVVPLAQAAVNNPGGGSKRKRRRTRKNKRKSKAKKQKGGFGYNNRIPSSKKKSSKRKTSTRTSSNTNTTSTSSSK